MVNKEKAKELRAFGKTYKEIAEELDCSIIWCKLNLKDVPKNNKEGATIKELIKDAKKPEGVTTSEIWTKMKIIYPNDSSLTNQENNMQDAKNAARFKYKIGKEEDTIIRPYWMPPTDAHLALKRVVQAVNLIDERLYEEVQGIIQELGLDETYIKSLTKAITRLTYGGSLINPIDIMQRLESLEQTADKLERRNAKIQSTTAKEPKKQYWDTTTEYDPYPSSNLPSNLSEDDVPY
jgi:hypothetical protein